MNSTLSIPVEMHAGLAVVSLAQPASGNLFDGDFTDGLRADDARPDEVAPSHEVR